MGQMPTGDGTLEIADYIVLRYNPAERHPGIEKALREKEEVSAVSNLPRFHYLKWILHRSETH
jgi:hypothetical protein